MRRNETRSIGRFGRNTIGASHDANWLCKPVAGPFPANKRAVTKTRGISSRVVQKTHVTSSPTGSKMTEKQGIEINMSRGGIDVF